MSEWKEDGLGDAVIFQRGHDLYKTNMKKGIHLRCRFKWSYWISF